MAIFIVGLVWPRANQTGTLGGFLIGLLLAAARFATEYIYASPACGEEDTRPAFASMNYMYFGKYKCISLGYSEIDTCRKKCHQVCHKVSKESVGDIRPRVHTMPVRNSACI